MRRGDLVVVALQGDYGKPRPALVIQSDLFDEHPSVTLLPVTSDLRETPIFRYAVEPDGSNGLVKPSQIMIDKAVTVSRSKIGGVLGYLSDDHMVGVTRSLALFLGFA